MTLQIRVTTNREQDKKDADNERDEKKNIKEGEKKASGLQPNTQHVRQAIDAGLNRTAVQRTP